jgi:hypothetical protein
MNRQKTKWLLLFIALFAVAGYLREFFFVHLNNIMFMTYYKSPSALKVPAVMNLFITLEYNTLYYGKYLFTLTWVVIFYAINLLALKKFTSTPLLARFLTYAYILLVLVSMVAMGYGYLVHERLQDDEYTLSRWLMGVAQSPIICLILLASEKLFYKSPRNDQQRHHDI